MSQAKQVSEARVVGTLALLYVFRMLGLFMVFPVMMVYGLEYRDATPLLLGLALGGYGLTQAFLQIPMGMFSDIWGRKPVIFFGLLMFVVGSVVAALSTSVWGLILGRALQGAGAIASAVMALLGDLTSEQNRTKAMATIGASIGLSFSVAMVLGPALAAVGGLSLIFWMSAALACLGMVILQFLVPSPPKIVRAVDGVAVPALLRSTLLNADLLRLNYGIFALHFVLTSTFIVVPLVLMSAGVESTAQWSYYLPVMVLAFVAMLPFMYLAERKRKIKWVFIGAVALLLMAELLLSQVMQLSGWVLGLFVFFTAFNLLEATLPSLISKQAPAGSKGTAMGVYSTCQFLGAAAGGVVGGWCYQYWGQNSVLWVSSGVVAAWLLLAFGMRQPRYLMSVCVPLDREPVELRLRDEVPGIVEMFWVKDQALLYLKVDDKLFVRGALNDYLLSV